MKNTFIDNNFLLRNKFAKDLYHNYASKMPIIDYHCHLSPKDIAEDRVFHNLTEVWIHGDHYKWRAMRTLGVDEKYITGTATDEEKFFHWAKTVPYTMRNPLYHWTHLELQRYFEIEELLNEKNAGNMYRYTSDKLNSQAFSCQRLLTKMNVEVVCTTEDPIDSLEFHQKLKRSDAKIKMSTSFRPDKSILIEEVTYNDYLNELEEVVGFNILTYNDLCDALRNRIQYFDKNGCKLSDHGLNRISFVSFTDTEVKEIFNKRRNNKELSLEEIEKFKSAFLQFLAETYCELIGSNNFTLEPFEIIIAG